MTKQRNSKTLFPFHVKLYRFYIMKQKLLLFVSLVALCVVIYITPTRMFGGVILDLFSNAGFTAILGALIGVIGTGLVQYDTQRTQIKIEAAAIRKESIYIPLYNELLELHETFTRLVFPKAIILNRGPFSQHSQWERIKKSGKKHEAPEYLADIYSKLYQLHRDYLDKFEVASDEFKNTANKIASQLFDVQFHGFFVNDRVMLECLQDSDSLQFFRDFFCHSMLITNDIAELVNNNKQGGISISAAPVSEEQKEIIYKHIQPRVKSLKSMKTLQMARDEYVTYIEDFIFTLETIIRDIDRINGRSRADY
jgi:hypothetical protein